MRPGWCWIGLSLVPEPNDQSDDKEDEHCEDNQQDPHQTLRVHRWIGDRFGQRPVPGAEDGEGLNLDVVGAFVDGGEKRKRSVIDCMCKVFASILILGKEPAKSQRLLLFKK